jgi:hypothetical protein
MVVTVAFLISPLVTGKNKAAKLPSFKPGAL